MESFESSCREFIKQPGFWLKIFVGVMLGAILELISYHLGT
jgi:hypothetical protein